MGGCLGRDPPQGTITKEEIAKLQPQERTEKAIQALGRILKEKEYEKYITDFINLLDSSGNHAVELSEIKKLHADMQKQGVVNKQIQSLGSENQKDLEQNIVRIFEQIDLNKDGKLTYEELKKHFDEKRNTTAQKQQQPAK